MYLKLVNFPLFLLYEEAPPAKVAVFTEGGLAVVSTFTRNSLIFCTLFGFNVSIHVVRFAQFSPVVWMGLTSWVYLTLWVEGKWR